MGLLSNLLGFRDGGRGDAGAQPLVVRPAAGAAEVDVALRLILAPPGAVTADADAAEAFAALARARGIDLAATHVAERPATAPGHPGRILSALLPILSPGRTMLMLTPHGGTDAADDATRHLIAPACAYAAARGVHLAQALLDPADVGLVRAFLSQGFDRMAELLYLQVAAPPAPAFPPLPAGTGWVPYTPETHDAFGRAILESYHDSLDCPALNGRRDIEDVIAGHKASGDFDPDLWYLLRDDRDGHDLGVLLLSAGARGDAAELVYLGLAPAARGRKLGELMMRQALAVTAARKLPRLCLAVDARNTPAIKLYYRHGMQRLGGKVAVLRDVRADAPPPP